MLLGGGILLLVMIVLFLTGSLTSFDTIISKFVYAFIFPETTTIMLFITNFGDVIGLGVMCILMIVFLRKKSPRQIPTFLFLMGTSLLLVFFLKNAFARPRPSIIQLFTFDGYSFPSAHAFMNASFYGYAITVIASIYNGKKKYIVCAFLFLMILLIGFSRIYLGAHYCSDVITGYTLALVMINITLIIEEKRREV